MSESFANTYPDPDPWVESSRRGERLREMETEINDLRERLAIAREDAETARRLFLEESHLHMSTLRRLRRRRRFAVVPWLWAILGNVMLLGVTWGGAWIHNVARIGIDRPWYGFPVVVTELLVVVLAVLAWVQSMASYDRWKNEEPKKKGM